MQLGTFSISLNVKDIAKSKAFYEALGFSVVEGDQSQGWLVMKNGDANIGIFQGMIEKNTITFNPGWDNNGKNLDDFEDVREIQKSLKTAGIAFVREAGEGKEPDYFIIADPDGNPILFDQHVPSKK